MIPCCRLQENRKVIPCILRNCWKINCKTTEFLPIPREAWCHFWVLWKWHHIVTLPYWSSNGGNVNVRNFSVLGYTPWQLLHYAMLRLCAKLLHILLHSRINRFFFLLCQWNCMVIYIIISMDDSLSSIVCIFLPQEFLCNLLKSRAWFRGRGKDWLD